MVDIYLTTPRSWQHHEIEYEIRQHMGGDLWYEAMDQFLHRPSNQLLYSVEEEQVGPLLAYLRQLEAQGRISEVFLDEGEEEEPLEEGRDHLRALDRALQAMRLAGTQNCFQSQYVIETVIATLTEEANRQREKG